MMLPEELTLQGFWQILWLAMVITWIVTIIGFFIVSAYFWYDGKSWLLKIENIILKCVGRLDKYLYKILDIIFWKGENNGTRNNVELYLPLSDLDIHQVMGVGQGLRVPFELTHSCYSEKMIHCGVCGGCTERRDRFKVTGISDYTTYTIDTSEFKEM
ncbi:unnamed protein product [marine sediment metagenome]|uniref:7-cyano-7-deazaguanine synthase n=1 Tax=marine sediment metagenome TaxID=412755 RepID=X1AQY6_9ZZZZ